MVSIKPIVLVCMLLFSGSFLITPFVGIDATSENEILNEVLDESALKENAREAMQAQFYENLGQNQDTAIRFYGEYL